MSDDLENLKDSLERGAIYSAIQQGNHQRAQQQRPKGPPCPYCGGPIPRIGVELCMHCNHKLAWVGRVPCKPGNEQATRKSLEERAHQQQAANEKQKKLNLIVLAAVVLIASIVASGLWINRYLENAAYREKVAYNEAKLAELVVLMPEYEQNAKDFAMAEFKAMRRKFWPNKPYRIFNVTSTINTDNADLWKADLLRLRATYTVEITYKDHNNFEQREKYEVDTLQAGIPLEFTKLDP